MMSIKSRSSDWKAFSKLTNDTPQTILKFIILFFAQHGRPPHIREIMAGADIPSTSVVTYNLKKLARQGHIRYEPGATGNSCYIGLNKEMTRRISATGIFRRADESAN